jgi:demethylphylloquinone reductase
MPCKYLAAKIRANTVILTSFCTNLIVLDLTAGTAELSEVAPTYRSVLSGTGISFLQAAVSDIDLTGKAVTVTGAVCDDLDGYVLLDDADQSRTVQYDKIVLALGAEPVAGLVMGAKEHAIPFYTIEDSYRVQRALRGLAASSKPTINVVVVGGSLCGVEIAATIVGALGRDRAAVTIVSRGDELLSTAAAANQKAGTAKMNALGVTVLTGTSVTRVQQGSIAVRDKHSSSSSSSSDSSSGSSTATADRELPADLVVWTAGSKPNSLLDALDLPKDSTGRVLVNELLAVTDNSYDGSVYCLGDCASVQGSSNGATAQVAMQQSEYVAWNLWAPSAGRKQLPFKFTNLGEMVSLGRLDGAVSALNSLVSFKGPAAAVARRTVYAARMPTSRQRLQAATSIAVGAAAQLSAAALETGFDIFDKLAADVRRREQQ